MDQAPGFPRSISLRPPAASVGPFPRSPPSRRPLPGSPGSTHPQNSPKSGEDPRRTETASTPRPSSALGPRISAPTPSSSFPHARPHTPGFRGCQKPELDPVAGQFLSLEAGRTQFWLSGDLLPTSSCPGIPFSSARWSLSLGS